jgi:hypothetical protein
MPNSGLDRGGLILVFACAARSVRLRKNIGVRSNEPTLRKTALKDPLHCVRDLGDRSIFSEVVMTKRRIHQ